MSVVIPRVVTPCIGVCSTALGDDVCRGCKRYSHEVIDWNSYTDKQKQIIDERLDGFLIQVVSQINYPRRGCIAVAVSDPASALSRP